MIDKNTMSLEDAREQFYSLACKKSIWGVTTQTFCDRIEGIGKRMAESPEMERAIIAYLLAVRKQEESKDGV